MAVNTRPHTFDNNRDTYRTKGIGSELEMIVESLEEARASEEVDNTPRRVKVYLLQGEDWLDNGTGYCKGEIDEETKHPFFLVTNELDENDIILKSFLNGSIQYQRQQETLIVWTDLSGKDLALSFQETEGCAHICEFIIEMQQSLSPEISLYYVIPSINEGDEITELITGPVNYPELPDELNLEMIQEIITQSSSTQFTRTKIANYVVEVDYISQLIDIFHVSESNENLANLYAINAILKALILYGDKNIIEDILSSEEKIMGLVGILEYDSEYPRYRACHRDFFNNKRFKSVIPVDNLSIFTKDFHLNYIKDVILARYLDDQTYSVINSLIYLNQVEIINHLKSTKILNQLFSIYDLKDNLDQKRNGLRLLHQYILIAKGLEHGQRSEFFSIISKMGLFKMINFAITDEDISIRVLGVELIVTIIEQDISLATNIAKMEEASPETKTEDDEIIIEVAGKTNRLTLSDDMTLVSVLAKLLVEDKNPGLKMQAFEALKILLDPMIASENEEGNGGFSITNFSHNYLTIGSNGEPVNIHDVFKNNGHNNHNHGLTQKYFRAFYTKVAPKLFKLLIDISKDEKYSLPIDEVLCQYLCELITFCSREHDVHLSRSFILDHDLLLGMVRILLIPCKPIAKLSVIRCLKHIILRNDVNFTRFIASNKILTIFFNFFTTLMDDDNLINSACLDLLDIILNHSDAHGSSQTRDNYQLLASYIYVNHKRECEAIKYVDIGSKLIKLVENNFNEPSDATSQNSIDSDDDRKPDASTPINEFDQNSNHEIDTSITSDHPPRNLFENIDTSLNGKQMNNILDKKKNSSKRSIEFDINDHDYGNLVNSAGFTFNKTGNVNSSTITSAKTNHKKLMLSVKSPNEGSEVSS